MFYLAIVLSLYLIQAARAFQCPHVVVMKDMNISEFVGSWHEYARNDGMDTSEINCAIVNYTQEEKEDLRVTSTFLYDEEAKMILDRKMKVVQNQPAVFQAIYRSGIEVNQFIVDTDYKTYALTVWCIKQSFQIIPTTYVSILSRSPQLPPEVSKKLFKTMQTLGYGSSSVALVNQIGCS